jgi:hypothetical protein
MDIVLGGKCMEVMMVKMMEAFKRNNEGNNDLENEIFEFVAKRCEKALLDSDKYRELESVDTDPCELQGIAEIVCYKKGFKDALNMILSVM